MLQSPQTSNLILSHVYTLAFRNSQFLILFILQKKGSIPILDQSQLIIPETAKINAF